MNQELFLDLKSLILKDALYLSQSPILNQSNNRCRFLSQVVLIITDQIQFISLTVKALIIVVEVVNIVVIVLNIKVEVFVVLMYFQVQIFIVVISYHKCRACLKHTCRSRTCRILNRSRT